MESLPPVNICLKETQWVPEVQVYSSDVNFSVMSFISVFFLEILVADSGQFKLFPEITL